MTKEPTLELETASTSRGSVTVLYRGLTRPYKPDQLPPKVPLSGTNFTDCPFVALRHASGRHGVVLVLELPASGGPVVSEELWLGTEAKRFMVWGRFDRYVVGVYPAKDLRAQVRRKGMQAQSEAVKSAVLKRFLEELRT